MRNDDKKRKMLWDTLAQHPQFFSGSFVLSFPLTCDTEAGLTKFSPPVAVSDTDLGRMYTYNVKSADVVVSCYQVFCLNRQNRATWIKGFRDAKKGVLGRRRLVRCGVKYLDPLLGPSRSMHTCMTITLTMQLGARQTSGTDATDLRPCSDVTDTSGSDRSIGCFYFSA